MLTEQTKCKEKKQQQKDITYAHECVVDLYKWIVEAKVQQMNLQKIWPK